MYLGSDGFYHLDVYDGQHKGIRGQVITIPLPLGSIMTRCCKKCGTSQQFEEAVRRMNVTNTSQTVVTMIYPQEVR